MLYLYVDGQYYRESTHGSPTYGWEAATKSGPGYAKPTAYCFIGYGLAVRPLYLIETLLSANLY